MDKNKKVLIVGAGGFIGGHLVSKILNNGNDVVASDIKPKEYWFQDFDNAENHFSRLKDYNQTLKVTKDVDYIFNWLVIWGVWVSLKTTKLNVCFQF